MSLNLLKCSCCPSSFSSLSQLATHVRVDCTVYNSGERRNRGYQCGNCFISYVSFKQYRKHVLNNHVPEVMQLSPCLDVTGSPSHLLRTPEKSCRIAYSPLKSPRAALMIPTPPSLKEIEKYLITQLSALIAGFHENPGMTEKTVQQFVDSFVSFQQDVLYVVLNDVLQNFLSANNGCSHLAEFLDTFKILLTKSFQPLRTIYSRLQHYQCLGSYISPQKVLLGFDRRQKSLKSRPLETPVFAQFIPIRDVLAAFFALPGLMAEMDEYLAAMADSTSVRHFVHSPTWQHTLAGTPDDGSKWYPLHLFFDDFEAGNPLGGHAGTNKLGAMYMSIPSLPPRMYSKIKFIFLVMLFKSHERKHFGNNVFRKVIEELNFLREVGIDVHATPTETVRVKFSVGCILGDNLGLNQICGFVESFSAKHCCRVCSCNYQNAPLREDPASLRNLETYLEDVEQHNVQSTGVQEKCVWLGVEGFDLFVNAAPDHMHDFLEGVCPYVMFVVLKGLETHLPHFTIARLNVRIRSFHFGPESNVPPLITMSKAKIGKMSASEMRVLVIYFGLLIGDMVVPFSDDDLIVYKKGEYQWKVPIVKGKRYEGHAYYRLYLWLRKLHDMLMCEDVDAAVAATLTTHIEALLKCYLELSAPFGRDHLPPKLHFLTHYPSAMLRNGPILSLSSMRFESKHKALKKALLSVASTINTPLSASKKIQLQLNSMLLNSKLPSSNYNPGALRAVDRVSIASIIRQFNLDWEVTLKSARTITSPLSIEYKIGQILCPEVLNGLPLFIEVERILYCPSLGRAFVDGRLLFNVQFYAHYHAYEVSRTPEYAAFEIDDLLYPLPNTLTCARDGKFYVTMRNYTRLFIF